MKPDARYELIASELIRAARGRCSQTRRFAEIERGEVQTVPWSEVRKRVFRPLKLGCILATGRVPQAKAIIGHITDRMREHYSTVGADEARGIGQRIISLVPAVHRTRGG